jgi:drug/metabolite transporter (DMT)-like permease
VISIAGVTVIIGVNQIFQASLNLGNGLAILASMFYGAYLITVKRGRNTLDTFTFTMISMLTSTLVLGLICLVTVTPVWGFEAKSWMALLLLGLVPQLVGWLAINQALGHISPTVASVSLLSQSVFTALFSVPVLGEVLTLNEIGGAVVVLAGIYLVNKK